MKPLKELSESIRKLFQEQREADAIKRAKLYLRISLRSRKLLGDTKISLPELNELLAEIELITKKSDVEKIIKKIHNICDEAN